MSKVVWLEQGDAKDDVPYFLTSRESQRHGVDLGRAIHTGLLTPEDFRALLAFCRSCPEGQGQQSAEDGALPDCAAPDRCANRAVLEGLRGIV